MYLICFTVTLNARFWDRKIWVKSTFTRWGRMTHVGLIIAFKPEHFIVLWDSADLNSISCHHLVIYLGAASSLIFLCLHSERGCHGSDQQWPSPETSAFVSVFNWCLRMFAHISSNWEPSLVLGYWETFKFWVEVVLVLNPSFIIRRPVWS